MSAYGYKQTFGEARQRVRFTPESGHQCGALSNGRD
jgi:hypothetical protein